jgi:TPP-dependent pyruvate/acetoin dehydrogenase alpha subunit
MPGLPESDFLTLLCPMLGDLDGDEMPKTTATQELSDEYRWRLFEMMLRIRRFEEAVIRLSEEGRFPGNYHLYIGQEATGAAAIACLEPQDKIATTHRNHGHLLARGAEPGSAMAEILGRATGTNGGRGGTFHLCDPERGFLSTSAIVGGAIGLAVGGGFACKQLKTRAVTMALFGDGSLEEGVSTEALNIAAMWNLPVVFLCEHNSAYGSEQWRGGFLSEAKPERNLCGIPEALGLFTRQVDGTSIAEVHDAVSEAVARCRKGEGPVFIEALTRRWAGNPPLGPHGSTGVTNLDMALNQAPTDGPHQRWYEKDDPVLQLARELARSSDFDRLRKVDREVQARIDAAARYAIDSPLPTPESALAHVFA